MGPRGCLGIREARDSVWDPFCPGRLTPEIWRCVSFDRSSDIVSTRLPLAQGCTRVSELLERPVLNPKFAVDSRGRVYFGHICPHYGVMRLGIVIRGKRRLLGISTLYGA